MFQTFQTLAATAIDWGTIGADAANNIKDMLFEVLAGVAVPVLGIVGIRKCWGFVKGSIKKA